MDTKPFRNAILKSLSPESIAGLRLRPVNLAYREAVESPGAPIRNILFPESGIVSVTTRFKNGFEVEVGMYGSDSLSGISVFMGTRESLNPAYMQIAGHGFVSPVANAAAEFQLGGRFQTLALRAVQAQFLQSMQNAGCNATHALEQRLARWLLLCADRTEAETMALSHEFMSDMLGSRRSSLTVAAKHLKDLGFIEYTRGSIRILDRAGLEGHSCECYRVLRDHLHDTTQYDSGLSGETA